MKILSIAVSAKKGPERLRSTLLNCASITGSSGDAHAGTWERQVSFLAVERIEECKARGLNVTFGDFAENIATEGIDWKSVPLGSRFRLGEKAVIEITKIGKSATRNAPFFIRQETASCLARACSPGCFKGHHSLRRPDHPLTPCFHLTFLRNPVTDTMSCSLRPSAIFSKSS